MSHPDVAAHRAQVVCGEKIEILLAAEHIVSETAQNGAKPGSGQPMDEWKNGMHFDRKPTVRRRHENGTSRDPGQFPDKLHLVFSRTNMLQNGTGMNHVKGFVRKRKVSAVGFQEGDARIKFLAETSRRRCRPP